MEMWPHSSDQSKELLQKSMADFRSLWLLYKFPFILHKFRGNDLPKLSDWQADTFADVGGH